MNARPANGSGQRLGCLHLHARFFFACALRSGDTALRWKVKLIYFKSIKQVCKDLGLEHVFTPSRRGLRHRGSGVPTLNSTEGLCPRFSHTTAGISWFCRSQMQVTILKDVSSQNRKSVFILQVDFLKVQSLLLVQTLNTSVDPLPVASMNTLMTCQANELS